MTREEIIQEVVEEWGRQDLQWGTVEERVGHRTDMVCLTLLTEEVGEVARAINDGEPVHRMKQELVQVAAVAVMWLETLEYRRNGD